MARINTGTMTVAIFAVLFGLVGAYALRAALVREETPPPPAPRPINVPLAAYDLPAGRKLTISDMVLVPMTREQMIESKMPLEALMTDTAQIAGRVLKAPLKQGKYFLTNELYPEGAGPNLADRLKPGMRAITVSVTDLAAVGGHVGDGSMVDVLFRSTPRAEDRAKRLPAIPQQTVTLVQDVEILSVGLNQPVSGRDPNGTLDLRQMNRAIDTNRINAVTLAVTPEQAHMLEAVRGQGDIRLSLRQSGAPAGQVVDPTTLEQLLGAKLQPQQMLDIYRGTTRQSMTYEDNDLIDESFGGDRNVAPNNRSTSGNNNQDATPSDSPASDQSTSTTPNRQPQRSSNMPSPFEGMTVVYEMNQ